MKNILHLFVLALMAFSCKKDSDPCDGVQCANGKCVDGSCLCEGLWIGEKCDIQSTPILITVRGIAVTNMPPTDNGAGWDLTSGADIYVVILQDGNELLNTSDDWRQNAVGVTSWQRTFTSFSANSPITIQLWDFDDFDADDFMGSLVGDLYYDTNGYPEIVTASNSASQLSFQLGPIEYL